MPRFPNLNAVRFYAAVCVVILHVRLFLSVEGNAGLDRLLLGGWDSVTLFFVLSGFLITYRLLNEKKSTGDISLSKFYIRRALRILPLYYLVFFLGLILSAVQADYAIEPKAILALLLLSGQFPYAWGSGAGMGLLFHFWSLGVEEWFYALWPQFMKRLKPLTAIGIFFFGSIAITAILFPAALVDRIEAEGFITLVRLCRFEAMAVGAFGAWIILQRPLWLKYIYWINLPAFAALGSVDIST
ncbi:MAG: acyltransferase [Anaerolineae bacterium]